MKSSPRLTETKSAQKRKEDADLDRALRDSFPASDPISITQPTTEIPQKVDKRLAKAGDETRRKTAGIRKPAPQRH
ncbi:hypothetical protein [Ferrovibrio terrae]|uniref:hypothetical protein n=1 Tax=Ferrovibrio terrae TaxID=2594003 RepID=UPI0031382C42